MRARHFTLALALAVIVVPPLAAQNPPRRRRNPLAGVRRNRWRSTSVRSRKPGPSPRRGHRAAKPDLQGYWRPAIAQAFSNEGVSGSEPLVGSLVMPWEKAPPMIVDPPDRKIPYQPWAVPIGRIGVNHNTYIDPRTACGSGGVPRVVLQDPNQILQPVGDQYMLWLFEDHHVQREIAMDGRPPLGGNIKVTNGDSRGRWDGNTLVIDVNNLNGYNWLDDSGNFYTDSRAPGRAPDADRPGHDPLRSQARGPEGVLRPWTMVWALVREKGPGFELLEEACREGEHDVQRLREAGARTTSGDPWRGR